MTQNVRLVAITKPVGDIDYMTVDEFIAYVARVSNPANQDNKITAPKLIKYLIKNKHFSPFEMVSLVMEIRTTRDIGRQILRHRSFSFQEFSQRYAKVASFVTHSEARLQDLKNRQNSIVIDDKDLQERWNILQDNVAFHAGKAYEEALELGIAKEIARQILPEGLTMSTLYMSGSLRSWLHYCQLRSANGTQLEHQRIAKTCWNIIKEQFPSLPDFTEEKE